MKSKYFKASILIPLLALLGCSEEVDQHLHPQLTSGKQLFEFHCSTCHHAGGNGNFLAGVPANKGTRLSASQIVAYVHGQHRQDSNMPVWREMPEGEAIKIATYLKSL